MFGDHDEAMRLLDLAADVHRGLRSPYWTARTLLDKVDAELLAGHPERVPPLTQEARRIASQYGYVPLLERIENSTAGP